MTVSYQIDREAALVRTRCSGEVTFAEVLSHFRELTSDTSLPARLDVLLDLTQTQSAPKTDQLWSVAAEVEMLGQQIRWGSCAIVADRDLLFGMSRVFHAFVEAHFARATVVRSIEEAERWLANARRADP